MKRLLTLLVLLIILTGFSKAQNGLKPVFQWNDSTLVGSFFHNNIYNEVWGFVQEGREYAVIGSTDGTHIFDVTDTTNIYMAEYIPGAVQGGMVVHRDYHDFNGYLYIVCDEGPSTLQIADLTHLPDSAPVVYDSNALFSRSHNIFIDSTNAIMYVCGGNNRLNLYDLSTPEAPQLLMNCSAELPFWNSIGYIHDIYVEDGIAYCNAETRGLFIVDFTDLLNVTVLGSLTQYPDQGYNHSGWLHPSQNIYAMADETHGMDIKILDVSDKSDIKVVSQINSGVDPNSIAHNLIFDGDYLYISYYYDGLYVYDVTDPSNPKVVDVYDTSTLPHATRYEGCWGVYPFLPSGLIVVSDMQNGLYLFDKKDIATSIQNNPKHLVEPVAFPNPFQEKLSISISQEHGSFSLRSFSGSIIAEGELNTGENTISLSETLPQGIYLLEVMTEDGKLAKKLIKH